MVAAEWKAHDGKVFSLTWPSGDLGGVRKSTAELISPNILLLSCGPEGRVVSDNN